MPIGTCDPATRGETWNAWTYSIDNNACWAHVRWTWDGTSVMPNCNGPVLDIRVVNTSGLTYYCNLPNKTRGRTNMEIPPGTDETLSGNWLRQNGLETYQETLGPTISLIPFG